MPSFRRIALVAAVALAWGCGSNVANTNPTPGSIVLTVTPGQATIQQGGSTTVSGSIVRTSFTGDVAISVTGQPAGVTGAVTLAPVSGGNSLQVTLSATSSTAPGTYPLVVTAQGSGIDNATANFTLIIAPATPASYTMSVAPTAAVAQGVSTFLYVDLVSTNFDGAITVTFENLPAGVAFAILPTLPPATGRSIELTASSTAAPGTYSNILVRGTAAGLTDRTAPLTLTVTVTGNFTIAPGSASVNVAQGSANTTTINATRTGGFTGAITYTTTGPSGAALPTGLTAAVTSTATADQNTLTATTTSALATGTYPVVIHANSPGVAEQTATVNVVVTVAGNFTIAAGAPSVSVVQGSAITTSINATRTGGFIGAIAYTTSGPANAALPAGLTAAVTPTATADQNTLTATTTAALAPGSYTVVVHANSPGVAEQTASVSVVVSALPAGNIVRLDFSLCAASSKPLWVAFQDGNGAFTRVVPVGDVYTFTVTAPKAAYAQVTSSGGFATFVQYFAQAESAAQVSGCASPVTGKTVNGTSTGYIASDAAIVSMGGTTWQGLTGVASSYQLVNVATGAQDLVAYKRNANTPGAANDKVIVRRGLNIADGGSAALLDFNSGEAVLPTTVTVTANGASGSSSISHSPYLLTGGSCTPHLLYTKASTGSSLFVYGIPVSLQLASDFYNLHIVDQVSPASTRHVYTTFHTLANMSVTLPAILSPTVSIVNINQGYRLLQSTFTMSSDYQSALLSYSDTPGTAMTVQQTAGYIAGASSITVSAPDLSTVSGWLTQWGVLKGSAVNYSTTVNGASAGSPCSEGYTTKNAAVTGSIGVA